MSSVAAASARQILVAEDDEGSRTLLQKYLESQGFAVTAVVDGEQASAALEPPITFDAVILDVMMPKRTGLEVLKLARAAGQTVPIIMATAASNPSDIVAALDAGADDYVTKPFSFPVLVARLQARLRTRVQTRPPPLPPRKSSAAAAAPGSAVVEEGLVGRLKSFASRLKKPAPAPLELKPGVRLGDRYVIEGRLGAGAFGTVYRARHVDLQQTVALKILTRGDGPHSSIEALRGEAQSACRVRHPNAVRVLDFGLLPPRSAFLVMELLDGLTLDAALQRVGRFDEEQALSAVRDVLGALGAMHRQGLVHRDVKPANVLLHREQGRQVPKLLDFGTARALEDPDDEVAGMLGSPAYLSPERIRGDDYDGRADVYACGVMLYKLLTSELPMDGDLTDLDTIARWHLTQAPVPPSVKRPGLSKAIDALVLKLLAKNPVSRPEADEAESLIDTVRFG